MPETFISEAIQPVKTSFDTGRMTAGEPGVPLEFAWRGRNYKVKKVLRSWKKLGPCSHGSGEQYVRKHFYEIETEEGERMTIYFDRTSGKSRMGRERWWLFSLEK